MQPRRQQPTRLLCPWDSPGKNTEVGCHFLLQCMKLKSEGEVAQLCPTLGDPMDCSLPGSSVHGIFQARVLEWGVIAFSSLTSRQSNYQQSLILIARQCYGVCYIYNVLTLKISSKINFRWTLYNPRSCLSTQKLQMMFIMLTSQ